jgi:hypothetical protein
MHTIYIVRLFLWGKYCIVRNKFKVISGVNYAYNKNFRRYPEGSLAQGVP